MVQLNGPLRNRQTQTPTSQCDSRRINQPQNSTLKIRTEAVCGRGREGLLENQSISLRENKNVCRNRAKGQQQTGVNITIYRKTPGIQSEKGKELKRKAVSEQVEAENADSNRCMRGRSASW